MKYQFGEKTLQADNIGQGYYYSLKFDYHHRGYYPLSSD
jgi:hypothetical protein